MTASSANGTAIRVIRERSGLTITDLSRRLASRGRVVHKDHLSNVELGRKGAGVGLLRDIALALDVDLLAITTMNKRVEP